MACHHTPIGTHVHLPPQLHRMHAAAAQPSSCRYILPAAGVADTIHRTAPLHPLCVHLKTQTDKKPAVYTSAKDPLWLPHIVYGVPCYITVGATSTLRSPATFDYTVQVPHVYYGHIPKHTQRILLHAQLLYNDYHYARASN
eukprot:6471522-Amphidinium_carterae.1